MSNQVCISRKTPTKPVCIILGAWWVLSTKTLFVAFVFVLVGENGLESFCFPMLLSHFVMKVIQVSQNDPGRCFPPYHVSKLPGQAVFCEGWSSPSKSLDAASFVGSVSMTDSLLLD